MNLQFPLPGKSPESLSSLLLDLPEVHERIVHLLDEPHRRLGPRPFVPDDEGHVEHVPREGDVVVHSPLPLQLRPVDPDPTVLDERLDPAPGLDRPLERVDALRAQGHSDELVVYGSELYARLEGSPLGVAAREVAVSLLSSGVSHIPAPRTRRQESMPALCLWRYVRMLYIRVGRPLGPSQQPREGCPGTARVRSPSPSTP